MSAPITVQEVASRLTRFPHDNYSYIGGFMRSLTRAASEAEEKLDGDR